MSETDSLRLTDRSFMKMLARPKLLGCAIIFLYIMWSFMACGRGKGDVVVSDIDTLDYTSLTTGVRTLISDSGITKYKLNAEKWYVFDRPEDLWFFPEGLYIEQFDTLFNIQASIQADTAYYYRSRQLWELKGNVEVLNREGQRFFGHSLFWDETDQEVYSREHVMIERSSGQMIESDFGFKSNQDMTRYELYSSHGHIDIDEQAGMPSDSTAMAHDSSMVANDTILPLRTADGGRPKAISPTVTKRQAQSEKNRAAENGAKRSHKNKFNAPDTLLTR